MLWVWFVVGYGIMSLLAFVFFVASCVVGAKSDERVSHSVRGDVHCIDGSVIGGDSARKLVGA